MQKGPRTGSVDPEATISEQRQAPLSPSLGPSHRLYSDHPLLCCLELFSHGLRALALLRVNSGWWKESSGWAFTCWAETACPGGGQFNIMGASASLEHGPGETATPGQSELQNPMRSSSTYETSPGRDGVRHIRIQRHFMGVEPFYHHGVDLGDGHVAHYCKQHTFEPVRNDTCLSQLLVPHCSYPTLA